MEPTKIKKCPFCAEEILFEAVKCRYCGEFLDGRPPLTSAGAAPPLQAESAGALGFFSDWKRVTRPIAVVAAVALLTVRGGTPFRRLLAGFITTHLVVEFETADLPDKQVPHDVLSRAAKIIEDRIANLVGTKPSVKIDGHRILIAARGVDDVRKLKDVLRRRGVLEFRLGDDSQSAQSAIVEITKKASGRTFANSDAVRQGLGPDARLIPQGDDCVPGIDGSLYILNKDVPLTGALLERTRVETGGDYAKPVVAFKFNTAGGIKLHEISRANIGKSFAIVLDGRVYSAPVIKAPIPGGSGIIEGDFTDDDARDLAIVLGSGAFPIPVKSVEQTN